MPIRTDDADLQDPEKRAANSHGTIEDIHLHSSTGARVDNTESIGSQSA